MGNAVIEVAENGKTAKGVWAAVGIVASRNERRESREPFGSSTDIV